MENDGGDHELGAHDLSSADALTTTSFHSAKDDEEADGPEGLSRGRNSMSKNDKRDCRIGRELRGSLSTSTCEEAPTLDGTTFINGGVTSPSSCTSRQSSELGTRAEPQTSSAREERFFSLDETPVGEKKSEDVLDKESDVGEGNYDANDLEAQLQRLWGRVPPAHDQGLALVRDALECRRELDGMLSELAAAEVGSVQRIILLNRQMRPWPRFELRYCHTAHTPPSPMSCTDHQFLPSQFDGTLTDIQ